MPWTNQQPLGDVVYGHVQNAIYDGAGLYVICIGDSTDDGFQPAPLPRLHGPDPTGTLYIGKHGTSVLGRLQSFANSIQQGIANVGYTHVAAYNSFRFDILTPLLGFANIAALNTFIANSPPVQVMNRFGVRANINPPPPHPGWTPEGGALTAYRAFFGDLPVVNHANDGVPDLTLDVATEIETNIRANFTSNTWFTYVP